MREKFHQRLNRLMKQSRVTVRDAAGAAGVSHSTLENWRSGSSPKDYHAVRKLAAHLGVSLSYLLTGEDDVQHLRIPVVQDAFSDGGEIFNGYLEVKIKRMIPIAAVAVKAEKKE